MLRGSERWLAHFREARRALLLLCGEGTRQASTVSRSSSLSSATDRMRALLEEGQSARALAVFGELGVGDSRQEGGKGRGKQAREDRNPASGRNEAGKQDKALLYQMADACDFALRAYANLGMPDPAARLVSSMWQRGIPVGRVANSSVVKALCEAGKLEEALKYLKSVSAQRSDIVGYNVLFTALRHRIQDEGFVGNAWSVHADKGGKRTAASASHDVVDLGERAWAVLEKKMEKNGRLRPDAITWSAVVRTLGVGGVGRHSTPRAGHIYGLGDEGNPYYSRWLEVANTYTLADRTSVAASYVGGLCAAREFERALETCAGVLADASEAGLLPVDYVDGSVIERDPVNTMEGAEAANGDTGKRKHASPISNARVACNTVLHASVATSNDGIMDRVIHAMTSRGLTPDTVTYNALLRRSLRRREGSLAIKDGLAEMQRMGLTPDQTSVEILIQSHALQGQIEDAERAVEVIIDEYGVERGRAWGTLMAACGMAGDVENVAHVFARAVDDCDRHQTELDREVTYAHLVVSCLNALHDALGKEYWRRVLHAPAAVALSLSSSVNSGKEALFEYLEEVALGLLKDIDDLIARENILHAPDHHRLLCLAALGKASDVMAVVPPVPLVRGEDRMMQVLARGQPQTPTSPSPDSQDDNESTTNNVLLHALARLGKLEHCFGLIQQRNLELSAKDYVALIHACAAHSPPMEELARRLLTHARERGIFVDTRFYNGLLLVRARLEGLDGVHDGIDEMRARGVEPNVFSYFVLREAAVLAKDAHAAESALQKIKDLQQGHNTQSRVRETDGAPRSRGGPWIGFYALGSGFDDD